MTKIIFLNGPPGCGKDTAASIIENFIDSDDFLHEKLSAPLKTIVSCFLNIPQKTLEQFKDDEIVFKNKTYRELQIEIFNLASEVFGEDWLGDSFVKRLLKNNQSYDYVVCSDGGRIADFKPILEHFSEQDLLIIQIMREDTSFLNDIRSYVDLPRVKTKHVVNDTMLKFQQDITSIASEFFA